MHELSLAAEMLDMISSRVPRREALTVVRVTVGPLSGVWPDAFEFGFTELARQEGYANARLEMNLTLARFSCCGCGTEFDSKSVEGACPACGCADRRVLSGTEFTLDSLEVEE